MILRHSDGLPEPLHRAAVDIALRIANAESCLRDALARIAELEAQLIEDAGSLGAIRHLALKDESPAEDRIRSILGHCVSARARRCAR